MKDCVFCRIIAGELPCFKIKETEAVIVFLSLDGHPLIVPKQHIRDIYDLPFNTAAAIMQEAAATARALKTAVKCDGINLVQSNGAAAGQDVFHFHLHIKPRWQNDGTVLSWDTKPKSKGEQTHLMTALVAALP